MEHRISLWKEDALAVVAIAFCAALILGGIDRDSAEVTAKNEKAIAEAKADIKPEDAMWMRLPLECQQWIAMRGAGEKWRKLPVCADLTQRAAK